MDLANQVYDYIEKRKSEFTRISDELWDYAELLFKEYKSANLLSNILEREGFEIQRGVAGMDTAFIGTFGEEGPVVGILGEYDALEGLSQKADITEKCAEDLNGPGHGCGHHLLGTAGVLSALTVKNFMEENNIKGTIKYFGCPAEEGGSGKVLMIREGCFEDVDIALTWHTWASNGYLRPGSLAHIRVRFNFYGTSAHAAASPYLGRSALDAVELMNVGVNYMREHIIPDARVHYAVTNTGGKSPNVVQSEAEVIYMIRAPKMAQVIDIYERVKKVANGAALMTETKMEYKQSSATSEYMANKTICDTYFKYINQVVPIEYTEEELAYARKFKNTISDSEMETEKDKIVELVGGDDRYDVEEIFKMDIMNLVLPEIRMYGSSDVGDVSWVVPTAHFGIVCDALGTPGHSWQRVAQGKSGIAHKGMIAASKVLALSALDFLNEPELVKKAKDDFVKQLGGKSYKIPVPPEFKPGKQ